MAAAFGETSVMVGMTAELVSCGMVDAMAATPHVEVPLAFWMHVLPICPTCLSHLFVPLFVSPVCPACTSRLRACNLLLYFPHCSPHWLLQLQAGLSAAINTAAKIIANIP